MKHRAKHWDGRRNARRPTQDYVWHRDAPTLPPEEMDPCALRRQLLLVTLLASTQVELEDLRTPEEVAADAVTMKPHDPNDGPADMDAEVEKDKLSLAGKLDPSGYTVVTAPSVEWYDQEFIREHPSWLFVYADMAPAGKDNDCIAKDDSRFVSGTPLAKVCRPLANTLPYAVCDNDGKALGDGTLARNKLRFQKATRRILNRARSNRIERVIFPPEDKLDLYQRFDTAAPSTAQALEAQMARIRYDAADWTPKSTTVVDTGSMPNHAEDSERVLRADASTMGSWAPPPVENLWGERPTGYRNGGSTTTSTTRTGKSTSTK